MRNYILADLYRIVHKKRRWVFLAILTVAVILYGLKGRDNLFQAMQNVSGQVGLFGVILAVIEIAYVYGEDFKAKTMQIAIGSGLPRQKVIHAKWLEFMVVAAVDILLYSVVGLVLGLIYYGSVGGFDGKAFVIQSVMGWVTLVVEVGCVMFIMFLTQGIGMATLAFLILSLGSLIDMLVLSKVVDALHLNRLHIQSYFLYNMLDEFGGRLMLGHISWTNGLGILIYMMISFALASILFKKKELEF